MVERVEEREVEDSRRRDSCGRGAPSRGPRPRAISAARCMARRTASWPALEAAPRQRGLERVHRDAVVEQPVAQVRRAEAIAAPGAAGRAAERHAAVPRGRSRACAAARRDALRAARRPRRRRRARCALRRSRSVRASASARRGRIEAARRIAPQCLRQLGLGCVGEPHHRDVDALARRRRARRRRRRRSCGRACRGRRARPAHRARAAVASTITPSMPSEPSTSSFRSGPAGGTRYGERANHTFRCHHAHRDQQVVDGAVAVRALAAGARRDPAAERRVLEGLREVAEREPVRPQRGFERRGRRCRPGRSP